MNQAMGAGGTRDLWRDAATIVVLALAPAAGVGIARFAYALVLPDMRASLGWSYATAGFLNTVNAAGYLAGAMIAASTIRRVGAFAILVWGSVACVAALAASALTGNIILLSVVRLVAGIGAAVAFIAGAVIATQISQRHPARASFLLSLYYIGPGIGILLSGIVTPLLLEYLGPGTWWIAWAVLAALAAVLTLALGLSRVDASPSDGPRDADRLQLIAISPVLISYLLFGVGYIAYMTFMVAYVKEGGGSATLQSAFWSLVGFGGMIAPWLWSRLIATLMGGRAVAVLIAVTLLTAILPLWSATPIALSTSATIFGSAFFAVVTATTAFVRRNYPPAVWPKGIALMTVAFGIGQTIGPVLTGAITDFGGSLSLGLALSAVVLATAVVAAFCQRDLPHTDWR